MFRYPVRKSQLSYARLAIGAYALLSVGLGAHVAADDGAETKLYLERSQQAVNTFQAALKKELVTAMTAGGPEAAIKVCNEKAPSIARSTSHNLDLEIGRTSLRPRNPANGPDPWERSMLGAFEARKAKGEPLTDIQTHTYSDGAFRYMKAIPMQGICTACHGTHVDPQLLQTIRALYPEDQATGYAEGDIRGAFSVLIKGTPAGK
jgi:hypothetical protein